MTFSEYAKKFYINRNNMSGINSQGRFIGALFTAAGSAFFPERPVYGKDDISYQGYLFRGEKLLSNNIKDSFHQGINEDGFINYFKKHIDNAAFNRIKLKFGIITDEEPDIILFIKALCVQFEIFILASEANVDDIIADKYLLLKKEKNSINSDDNTYLNADVETEVVSEVLSNDRFFVSQKLINIRISMSWDILVKEKTQNFKGRKWLYDKCNDWLTQHHRNKILWINGLRGTGKSTFSAMFKQKIISWNVGVVFCQFNVSETRTAAYIIRSISYYLNSFYDEYTSNVIQCVIKDEFDKLDALGLFQNLIYELIPSITINGGDRKLCIIIDALDELDENEQDVLLPLLIKMVLILPDWIRFVVTSKPETKINRYLDEQDKIVLGNIDDNNKRDIEEYFRCTLDSSNISYSSEQMNTIISKSENNFLYICKITNDIMDKGNVFLSSSIPQGLGGLYFQDIERKYQNDEFGISNYMAEARPIFELMVAAKGSMSTSEISSFLDIELGIINMRLSRLSSFIVDSRIGSNKKIFHGSFVEWLTSESAYSYRVDRNSGSKKILDFLGKHPEKILTDNYLKNYAFPHIVDDSRSDVLYILLEYDDVRIIELVSNKLYGEYTNRPDKVKSLLKTVRHEKIRPMLISAYRNATVRGNSDLAVEIMILIKDRGDFVRAVMLEGETFQEKDDYASAEAKFYEALSLSLTNLDILSIEQTIWDRRHIGLCYSRLGSLAKAQGDIVKSKTYYTLSHDIFTAIIDRLASEAEIDVLRNSNNYWNMRDLMVCTSRMGDIAFSEGNYQEAINCYEKYKDICIELLSKIETLEMKRRLSIIMLRLGDVKLKQRNPIQAYTYYSGALQKLNDMFTELSMENIDVSYFVDPMPIVQDTNNSEVEYSDFSEADMPREKRELDYMRDISLCYIRLGNSAKVALQYELAQQWYEHYFNICEFLFRTRRTLA